jgi:hypothetical protein
MKDITEVQKKAMEAGEKACLDTKSKGGKVNLMDEGRLVMSEEDLAFSIGWNSKVFDSKEIKAE